MSLLRRIVGASERAHAVAVGAGSVVYSGNETLEVAGESHHQELLWRLVGGKTNEHVRETICAVLTPEPENQYDSNAICVSIDGHPVGYLSRENAAVYQPGLLSLMRVNGNRPVALNGVIAGGGMRDDGVGFLGVFLDHDPADFGLEAGQPRYHLRTGWSDAVSTDADDDRYDLSWFEQLPLDDEAAIPKLRSLLEAESDPIDRHFMLSALEERLYHSRDRLAGALDEFDAVCEQHHAEMTTIRPALFAKFKAIPVIDMYRQATIRCQKAKNWEESRKWGERGLATYAQDAARPEVVADLHRRLIHAESKIEAIAHPPPRRSRPSRRATPAVTETLKCSSCGAAFERTKTRGRKPQLCPACRGGATRMDQTGSG
jgi:HIRAN domain